MQAFEQYVGGLETAAQAVLDGQDAAVDQLDFATILNGAVGAELRQRVALNDLQERGAFFTGTALRSFAMLPVLNPDQDCEVLDPACGAGDLLLSFANHLPTSTGLGQTLAIWGTRLHGRDIEPLFVRAARARLVLAAYHRGVRVEEPGLALSTMFPELRVGDSLAGQEVLPEVGYIVLNPPFIGVAAPADCAWGSGTISGAALLLERSLRDAKPDTRIIAILPDVLRSGSRYSDWRRMIETRSLIQRIAIYGSFDQSADVDVFVLDLIVRSTVIQAPETEDPRWKLATIAEHTLGDLFEVSTGAVVPHRHEEKGDEFQYLHTRNATPWGTLDVINERRRFCGTVVQPPVVVIRRTSSPSDRQRPVGTVVLGDEPIAVENHLLVLKPKDGGVGLCQQALALLRLTSTRVWLDQRIRTRHLTVSAIREIPWSLPRYPE